MTYSTEQVKALKEFILKQIRTQNTSLSSEETESIIESTVEDLDLIGTLEERMAEEEEYKNESEGNETAE